MRVTSLGCRTDLALLRLGGSTVEDRGDHLVVRSPHNPDHWWGNFLLLDRVPPAGAAASWLDRFAAAFPGAGHVCLAFDGTDTGVDDLAWFTQRGFYAEAQVVLTASRVHPPAGADRVATCRALSSDDDWAQSVELSVRCNDQIPDRDFLRRLAAARVATRRGLVRAGHGAWFGAFRGGRLVSQLGLFRAGAGLARFQTVQTDPAYRRQGLSRALLHHAARYGLDDLGAGTLVIVADPDYLAADFYRSVGFTDTEIQAQVEHVPARRH